MAKEEIVFGGVTSLLKSLGDGYVVFTYQRKQFAFELEQQEAVEARIIQIFPEVSMTNIRAMQFFLNNDSQSFVQLIREYDGDSFIYHSTY